MIIAALYALTALVTGLYNVYRIMGVVNGAPLPLLNCIALLGSAMLLVAAGVVVFRSSLGAKLGLVGAILLWVYYLPMIVVSFFMPFSAWQEIHTSISFRDYIPVVGMLLGPILLIVCTVAEVRTLRAPFRQ